MENIDFEVFAKKAAKIAMDKKAQAVSILDVRLLTEMTNFFVIATANSAAQINAVCGGIEDKFKEEGLQLVRREDRSSQNWRVIDYGGIIIHIMTEQSRQAYKLEDFWKNAKQIQFEEFKPILAQEQKIFAAKPKKSLSLRSLGEKVKVRGVAKRAVKKIKNLVKKTPTKKIKPAKKKRPRPLDRRVGAVSVVKRAVKKVKKAVKKTKKVIKNAKKK
ncbi:MAG: ribosome silencing factor [Elusimicrobiota bacterium]|jgi:ribosome-associated protein|nr:ribosome silencing factor [Elusimicrobiota bacterium]